MPVNLQNEEKAIIFIITKIINHYYILISFFLFCKLNVKSVEKYISNNDFGIYCMHLVHIEHPKLDFEELKKTLHIFL